MIGLAALLSVLDFTLPWLVVIAALIWAARRFR